MAKILRIKRHEFTDAGTFGIATFGDLTFNSLEYPKLDHRHAHSCIAAGKYRALSQRQSSSDRQIYALHQVPFRQVVEINLGIFAGDTEKGYFSDMTGAISFGLGVGLLQPADPAYRPQQGLLGSRGAMIDFDKCSERLPLIVEIFDP